MQTQLVSAEAVLPMRTRYREEMNCQIVHDSIHSRPGWTLTYRLEANDKSLGFATVAVGGPWKDQPTLLEFYVLPEHRGQAFVHFETLLAAAKPQRFEVQSNDVLPFTMAHTYGREILSEKIVFRDAETTAHPSQGAVLLRTTTEVKARQCLEQRSGSSEWTLELDGAPIGSGGFLFHYNRPYADVYMRIDEPFRRRGFATYFVQELKRECYQMGAVPAARCSPENAPSFRTLQRAGFIPSRTFSSVRSPPSATSKTSPVNSLSRTLPSWRLRLDTEPPCVSMRVGANISANKIAGAGLRS